jgi:type I restriction enzyme S subunit
MIKFARGDILFGNMRPYFHKVGRAPFDGICRTTTFVLRPESAVASYLVFALSATRAIEFATGASVGTTIPYVKWEALRTYPILLPGPSGLEKFEHLVTPFLDLIDRNNLEARTVAATRDALLPKVISGEVRLRDLEELVAT